MNKRKGSFPLSRREFIKLLGGGIIITFTDHEAFFSVQQAQRREFAREYPQDFNAYLRIGEDGRVSCYTGKVELGQGIETSLAQILAEELDLSLDSVDVIMGDTDVCPWDMGTFGSRTIKYFGPVLRQAAAEARAVLIELASQELKVSPENLATKEGMVFDPKNPEKKVSYSELTKGKTIERHLKQKPPSKPKSSFSICGKSAARKDARLKVCGEAKFAGDVLLPGMLYARILRPPAHGARINSIDLSEAEKIEGAQIIRENDLVAVLHPSPHEAEKSLKKIKAEFELPDSTLTEKTIYKHLEKVAPQGEIITQKGNLEEGKRLSSLLFASTYFTPYVAHAPLEPHTATANVEGERITIWASTQRPFGAQEEVAQALGIPLEKVRIITPYVGGGFGGKNRNRQIVEAARLAWRVKKPVQVAWTRSEEFFYDTFMPAAVVKITSGLDSSAHIVLWDYEIFYAGERTSQPFYDIPHYRILLRGGWMRRDENAHPFEVGPWRAPGSNTNTFARESQIDIMAESAGLDPLEFRLRNLKDERMKRVLEEAANIFGWSLKKAPSGRGYGVACVDYLGTYVATMAEVEVDRVTGKVRVKRMVGVQDMGEVINPEGAKAQIEGCLMMGLGYALSEEIHFQGGKILDLNFDTYEIPRFSWLPKIETALIPNPDLPPQGGGEPAITCVGGMLANAVFDATGIRFFKLPLTPWRIKEGLKKVEK